MSAIGDYIHYRASNYLEHGTTEHGIFKAFQSKKKEILYRSKVNARTSLNKRDKIELAGILAEMKTKPAQAGDFRIKQAQYRIQKVLKNNFDKAVGKINFEKGDVVALDGSDNKIGIAQSSIDIEDMVDRMNKMGAILNNLEHVEDVKDRLEQLKNAYNTITKQIISAAKAEGKNVQESLRQNMYKKDQENFSLVSIKQALNNMILEYAAYPAISLQKGILFENLIAYAPYVARQCALTGIGKVIGDDKESASLNSDKFTTNFQIQEKIKNTLVTTAMSQGKVDVAMTWNETPVNISAKNVNLSHRYVTVMRDSPLLYLLQDEDATYVNHILNLLAKHPSPEELKLKDNNTKAKERNALKQINNRKKSIINELRLLVLYKALTGDVNNRKTANLFIVNDNSKTGPGSVKVFDMNELIYKAQMNITNNASISGLASSSFKDFKNKSEKSPADRIFNLLQDVHSRKITAGISTKILVDK